MTATSPDAYRTAWALFVSLEAGDDDRTDALFAAYDEDGGSDDDLIVSAFIVGARLRQVLQDHARTLGCTCGDDEWLNREALFLGSEPS